MRELYIAEIIFNRCQIYVICRTGIEAERVHKGFSSLAELIEWTQVHGLLIFPHRTGKLRGIIEYLLLKRFLRIMDLYADFDQFLAACYSNPDLRIATASCTKRIERNIEYIEQFVNNY